MPRDVIITPASGLIDFQDGTSKALIQADANGNLSITNTGGNLSVGNTAADVYIGDGINNVNMIFERSGNISCSSGQTLSLGSTSSGVDVRCSLRLKPQNAAGSEGGEIQFEYPNGNIGYWTDVFGTIHRNFNLDSSGIYTWMTNSSERMRLVNGGALKVSSDGSYNNSGLTINEFMSSQGSIPTLDIGNRNGSYTGTLVQTNVSRSSSSAYTFILCASGNFSDYEFVVRGDGLVSSDGGTTMSSPADYAEMFEWEDGNPDNEDRRGYSVTLVGNQIRKSVEGDSNIIGVVSGNPAVLADNAWNHWTDKYMKDEFNCYIWEEHNIIEWGEIVETDNGFPAPVTRTYEDWNIPEDVVVPEDAVVKTHDADGKRFTHRKLNPDYDPDQAYIPREDRPEWSAVGLVGKLRLRKGQPVGERWIKMRDISETVEEWLVR